MTLEQENACLRAIVEGLLDELWPFPGQPANCDRLARRMSLAAAAVGRRESFYFQAADYSSRYASLCRKVENGGRVEGGELLDS